MAVFESLPSELKHSVLSYLDSPQDFYYLIRASPAYFRIFRCDEEHYLYKALKRSTHEFNLLLAVRVLKAGKISVEPPTEQRPHLHFVSPGGISRQKWIQRHVWRHQNEAEEYEGDDSLTESCLAGEGEKLSGEKREEEEEEDAEARKRREDAEARERPVGKLERLRQLSRMWRLTDYFIGDYSQKALRHIKRFRLESSSGKSQIGPQDSPEMFRHGISRVEYDRMQRAFLYFELYRRLFGGLDPYVSLEERRTEGRIDHTDGERSDFGWLIAFSENVELNSVYDYIAARMGRVFGRVRSYVNDRLDAIDRNSARDAFKDGNENVSTEGERLLLSRLQKFLEDTELQCPATVAFLVECGLPFCRRFFSMPVSKQALIIDRCRVSDRRAGLAHTCIMSRSQYGEMPNFAKYCEDNFHVFPRVGSCGWFPWWTTLVKRSPEFGRGNYEGHYPPSDYARHCVKARYGTGLAGFFFWDEHRLQALVEASRPGWPFRVGCALFDELCQSGFESRVGLAWYFNLSDDGEFPYFVEHCKRKCAPSPALRPEEVVLSLADANDDGQADEVDVDGEGDDASNARNVPLQVASEAEIKLEIDAYDY